MTGDPQSETVKRPGGRRLWWLSATLGLLIVTAIVVKWTEPPESSPEAPAVLDAQRQAQRATSLGHPEVFSLEENRTQPNQALIDELVAKADPGFDNWESERLGAATAIQLEALVSIIKSPGPIDTDQVAPFVADGFACTVLGGFGPEQLVTSFDDVNIVVQRLASEVMKDAIAAHQGAPGLVEALDSLADTTEGIEIHFELMSIDEEASYFNTRVQIEMAWSDQDSVFGQTATWYCRWTYPMANDRSRLLWIGLEQYEQVSRRAAGGRLFADCTESVLGRNSCYGQQVLPGINHWIARMSRQYMSMFGHHGLVVGDVNGDQLDDLYVCDAGGLPNRLYVHQLDGTLVDRSSWAGVDWLDSSTAALLVDLDNDDDQDLVVVMQALLLFSENDGSGRFTVREKRAVFAEAYSLCAADYDLDGDLDVYVCSYNAQPRHTVDAGLPEPVPYHDANNGGANVLWRNEGHFRFVDATESAGLNQNNRRFSFSAAWEDYDNDGDVDLYVANDFGRNNLYRNDRGTFRDMGEEAGVEDIAAGMSAAWGDFNRDGLIDLYVGNMSSAAGHRVSYQSQFANRFDATSGDDGTIVPRIQRMARGNTLFSNVGDGTFHDVSRPAAVTQGRWAWSSKFADLNNDGWLDLVVANGYITGQDSGDL